MMVYVLFVDIYIYIWNRNTKKAKKVGVILWCTRFWGADTFVAGLFFSGQQDGNSIQRSSVDPMRSSLSCTWSGGFTTAALVLRPRGLFIWRPGIRCGDTAGHWLPDLCGSSAATGFWRGRFLKQSPAIRGCLKTEVDAHVSHFWGGFTIMSTHFLKPPAPN